MRASKKTYSWKVRRYFSFEMTSITLLAADADDGNDEDTEIDGDDGVTDVVRASVDMQAAVFK